MGAMYGYIYLHLPSTNQVAVGKDTPVPCMDPMKSMKFEEGPFGGRNWLRRQ